MNPEKLRESLKSWLKTQIRIDAFSLNPPKSILNREQPPSAGLDLQASNFKIATKEGMGMSSFLVLEGTLPFQIAYRFSKDCKYTDIPRGKAESVLCSLMGKLNDAPNCIEGDIILINPSGEVVVYEQEKGDWILAISLVLEVQFQCDMNELFFDYGVFKP